MVNKIIKIERNKYKSKDKNLNWIIDKEFLKQYYCFDLVIFEIVKDYANELLQILNDDFPKKWGYSVDLFNMCLEYNRFDLVKKFEFCFIPNEVLIKNSNKLIEMIESNNPTDFKFNKYLLNLCLKENRFDLVKKFKLGLISDHILKEYKNVFFDILENDFPKHWKKEKSLFKLCQDENRLELLSKFDQDKFKIIEFKDIDIDSIIKKLDIKIAEIEKEEADNINNTLRKIKPVSEIS